MIVENKHNYDTKAKYSNEANIEIYKDTLLKATQYEIADTAKYTTSRHNINHQIFNKKGIIKVLNLDSVGAIVAFSHTKTAVLNMASAKRPGGGVAKGSKAQEEALFRCSNLGLSISKSLYPLENDEFLYTKNAVFFKNNRYEDLPYGFTSDVITCAAINLNSFAIYGYSGKDIELTAAEAQKDPEYVRITKLKIHNIIVSALRHQVETLILGAWGCGVFKNDPQFIAECFKEELEKDHLKYCFDNIIFAVINDKNSVANNFEIFSNVLNYETVQ